MKDRLSVGRFVSASYCGMLGKAEMEERIPIITTPQMNRGSEIHHMIEKWANGLGNIPMDWEKLLPDKDKIIDVEREKEIKIDNVKWPFIGSVDILTDDSVYEIKSGKKREWHKLQVMAYNYLFSKNTGYLIYVDSSEIVQVDGMINEEMIRLAEKSIYSGNPSSKNIKCEFCPLKPECPTWFEKGSAVIDALLVVKRMIAIYEKKREIIYKTALLEIENNLKKEREEEKKLLKECEKLDPKTYRSGHSTVTVYEKKVSQLPENWQELRPYEKYPLLYNDPKPKMNDMKKDIGEEVMRKCVRVNLEDESLGTE